MNDIKKHIKTVFALALAGLCLAVTDLKAQQVPLGNQYLINGFSLSPAYAGASDNVETLISYRRDWAGISGAPESRLININGALPNLLGFLPKVPSNMGLGATILSEQAGIFRSTSASLSYAYQIKIAAIQSVRLGLSLGIVESNVDLASLSGTASSDPMAMNTDNVRRRVFDASFGVLYKFQNLDFGFAIPRLIETKVKNDGDTSLYGLSRHYIIHASYFYNITKDFQVQPFVVTRMTANSEFLYEITALVKYQKMVWLGLMYRKTNIGISLGGQLFNVVQMNYSYEFSGQGLMGKSSGTHEISLGFLIGKNDDGKPAPTLKKPYYDWIDK